MPMTIANAKGCRNERKSQKPTTVTPTSKANKNNTLAIEFDFSTSRPECPFGLSRPTTMYA